MHIFFVVPVLLVIQSFDHSVVYFVSTAVPKIVESTSTTMDEPQEAEGTEAAGQQQEVEGTTGDEGEGMETGGEGEKDEEKGEKDEEKGALYTISTVWASYSSTLPSAFCHVSTVLLALISTCFII